MAEMIISCTFTLLGQTGTAAPNVAEHHVRMYVFI